MTCNVGLKDKRLRMVAGAIMLILGVVFRSAWGLIGMPLILTALAGYCPAYTLFKISTKK